MCKQTGQMKFQLKNECESWGPNQKNKKEKSEIEAEAYGWGCPLCKASRPPQYALLAGKGSSQSSWNEMSWGELSCDSKWMPSAKCSARCTDIGTRTRLQPDPPPSHYPFHFFCNSWPTTPFTIVNTPSSDWQCNFVANLEDVALPAAARLIFRIQGCKQGRPSRGIPAHFRCFPIEFSHSVDWFPLHNGCTFN